MANYIEEINMLKASINDFYTFYQTVPFTNNIPSYECSLSNESVIINPINIIDNMLLNLYDLLDEVIVNIQPTICHDYETNLNNYLDIIDKLNSLKKNLYSNNEINQKVIDTISNPKILNSNPSSANNAHIIVVPLGINLLHDLIRKPDSLYNISPSEFETLILELYTQLGFIVKHTPLTCDGGKDIILTEKNKLGDFIYYVECKHFNPKKPVGVGVVRQFSGTVLGERINGGIIVTSSYFSKPAQSFIRNNHLQYQIKLQDSSYILELIQKLNL